MLTLYDYQDVAVGNVRTSYTKGRRSPLLVIPTGGGKTVIFSHIAATTSARSKNVMILVHRVELLRQTSKALEKSDVWHGLINPKYTPDMLAPVQVASVQTLVKRMHKLPFTPELIIVDEAHHATAGTWRKILDFYPNARVLGVTATPIRSDGAGLLSDAGGLFDDLIIGPQISELINRGFLVKPIVYAPLERINLTGVKKKMGDYDKAELEARLDIPHVTGSAVAHYAKLCPGVPAIVFCVSVAHAEHVANEFRAAGFVSFSVDGSMEDSDRKRILNGLGNGKVQVVTSCDLISEGTDIPAVGCCIFLRPTESLGLYLQQAGRGLRSLLGKTNCIILDHVGNVIKHGMPDEDRDWAVYGIRKEKSSSYVEGGTRVKQCPKCYAVHEIAPNCPQCGHFYVVDAATIKVVEGELEVVTEDVVARMKQEKAKEVYSAQTFEELQAIGMKRGYKPNWAVNLWRNKRVR